VPIRTPRGRSAAYRSVWQWPLRSPLRLATVVLVVVAAAVAATVGLGLLNGTGPAAQPAAGPTGRPTAGPTTGPGSGAPVPSGTATGTTAASPLPLSQAPAEALTAAERWARAWVRPAEGTSARQWLDGLRPLTTEEYLGVLSGVDPENIPATEVVGEAEAVRVADRNVQVEVETDVLTLRVLVVDTEVGWRVAGYDRA
jgi:hypothetical protein